MDVTVYPFIKMRLTRQSIFQRLGSSQYVAKRDKQRAKSAQDKALEETGYDFLNTYANPPPNYIICTL